jgi:uncharacterized protein YdeI (YjbR/CyaY-like superfamily)
MARRTSGPRFFATPEAFRRWLERNHETATELVVGFYKKGSGRRSITYPQAVDQALCFGWIDGVRRGVDAASYSNRFTPRRPRSMWSAINIKRVEELTLFGLMHPAGLRAFETRTAANLLGYSYEQRADARLDPAQQRRFRANKNAWADFQRRPAGYRQAAIYWVASAKRPETRERRLDVLIQASAKGETIPPLTRPSAKG